MNLKYNFIYKHQLIHLKTQRLYNPLFCNA